MTDRPLETQKRLLGNASLLSAAEVAGQLLNFAFVVCLARAFGRDLLGAYAFAMAVGALIGVLVSTGTHGFALRRLSREPERTREVTEALLGYQALASVLLVLAAHFTARSLGASPLTVWAVTLVTASRVLMRVTQLLVVGFTARQEMAPAALVPVTRRVLTLILAGAAILWGASAGVTLVSMPVAALIALAAAGIVHARRFGRPRLRVPWAEIGGYLRSSLPFFYVIALTALYTRLGIILLTALDGESEAGLFASAERLVSAVGTIQLMFATALFPVLSRLWTQQRERFGELVQRAGRVVLLLSLPAATLLTLFAPDVIGLVYGAEFSDAAGVLAGVAWVLVAQGLMQILAMTSQAADCQRLLVTSRAIGLGVLALASLALIPPYGAIGLVAAVVLGEAASAASNQALLRRARVPVVQLRSGVRVALACVLAAGLALLVSDLALWLRLAIVTGGGAAALWLVGAVRGHDLDYLRAILATPGREP